MKGEGNLVFAFIARLFGKKEEPALDPAALYRFKQLRERNSSEEPAQGKKDLLIRMRAMELQTASIVRWQHGNDVDEVAPGLVAKDGAESSGRDVTGRKGF